MELFEGHAKSAPIIERICSDINIPIQIGGVFAIWKRRGHILQPGQKNNNRDNGPGKPGGLWQALQGVSRQGWRFA